MVFCPSFQSVGSGKLFDTGIVSPETAAMVSRLEYVVVVYSLYVLKHTWQKDSWH